MLQMLAMFLALYLPVFVICLAVYLLGRIAVHEKLGHHLRVAALIWAPLYGASSRSCLSTIRPVTVMRCTGSATALFSPLDLRTIALFSLLWASCLA